MNSNVVTDCTTPFYGTLSLCITPLNVKVEGTDCVYSEKIPHATPMGEPIVWNKAKSASNLVSIKKLSSIVYR